MSRVYTGFNMTNGWVPLPPVKWPILVRILVVSQEGQNALPYHFWLLNLEMVSGPFDDLCRRVRQTSDQGASFLGSDTGLGIS